MRFTNAYDEQVRLEDGSRLQVRAIRPSDQPALAAGFSRLSAASRRQRFNGAKSELTAQELSFLTLCDGQFHFALVALHPGEECATQDGVGVVRFIRTGDDPAVAEIGITVIDAWQQRGVGRLLLERIVAAAAERGIERLRAVIRVDNPNMLGLLAEIARPVKLGREGELQVFEFAIPAPRHTNAVARMLPALGRLTVGSMLFPLHLGELSLRCLLGAPHCNSSRTDLCDTDTR